MSRCSTHSFPNTFHNARRTDRMVTCPCFLFIDSILCLVAVSNSLMRDSAAATCAFNCAASRSESIASCFGLSDSCPAGQRSKSHDIHSVSKQQCERTTHTKRARVLMVQSLAAEHGSVGQFYLLNSIVPFNIQRCEAEVEA